ncbi:hypothetical protein GQ44DRAFT_709018 [Phaeosphaeriaceae sp. PMI808]|nr:hypothetical protein GQ44DRAFT_709018 [Phaeosphaeriaceae sp. PMI808]
MSEDTKTTARVYSPLPCTECYTSLNAANRAAKNVQIKLSHEKNPKMLAKHWQDENLAELNKRASAMETAEAEEDKYWKSQFKGAGLSSTEFELIVENVGLCGPRNL